MSKIKPLDSPEFLAQVDAIPGLDVYKKKIESFFKIDLTAMSQEQISKAFIDTVGVLPHMATRINPALLNNQQFYRVRKISASKKKPDLNLVRSFSYPDPHLIDKNGRANIKDTTVFYCSDRFNTAVLEVCPEPGDTLYVSFWNMDCDRDIVYKGYLPLKSMKDRSRLYELALKDFNHYQQMLIDHKVDHKMEQLVYIYDVITEVFTMGKEPYNFSSYLAHSMMYNYFGIDFLLYPSRQTQFTGNNMAIHPNFVDQFMTLERVYTLEIKDVSIKVGGDCSMNMSYGKVGHVEKTNIQWLPFTIEENEIIKRACDESFQVVARAVPVN